MAKTAKKKVSKKKVTRKSAGVIKTGNTAATAAKSQRKAAGAVKVPTPKKGDIVFAYNKHFVVDSASAKGKTVMATHCTHVEMGIDSNLSREILFADISAVYRLLGD